MQNILYMSAGAPYLNITNMCPCRCVFCVRDSFDTVGGSGTLWLDAEPNFSQVKSAFDRFAPELYSEITFCGYGEPTCALDLLIETAEFIRGMSQIKIRLNTNGLSDLINKKPTAARIASVVDTVSISLNAPNSGRYCEVTRPCFGGESYEAMLQFAGECKSLGTETIFTVVNCIAQREIEACRIIAQSKGIPLRVREMIE